MQIHRPALHNRFRVLPYCEGNSFPVSGRKYPKFGYDYFFREKKRGIPMDEPLTPDEDVVFRELTRLDVEPNQIPVELFAGFMERLADTSNMSVPRARLALQGLIDKGKFDTSEAGIEERIQNERTIIRDLLLHDPEIRELLKKIVADLCAEQS
jgi:hypothetical protein